MNFSFALKQLEDGKKVRRVNWGFSNDVFLLLEDLPLANSERDRGFYIYNTYNSSSGLPYGYDLTYQDICADDWELT